MLYEIKYVVFVVKWNYLSTRSMDSHGYIDGIQIYGSYTINLSYRLINL